MADQSENNTSHAGRPAGVHEQPWRWSEAIARAPLVAPAVGLMVGIVADSALAIWPWAYVLGAAAVGGLLVWPVMRRRGGVAAAVALAVCCEALLHHNAYRRVPRDHVVHRTAPGAGTLARVRGTVLTAPRISRRATGPFGPWMYSPDRSSFLLETDSIEEGDRLVPASGRARVTVKEAVMDLAVGQRVELFGRLYRPSPPDNPGQFDWARWNRRHGVLAGISCDNRESVRVLETAGAASWRGWLGDLRRRARGLLLDEMLSVGGPETGLLEAMILARRTAVDPSINEAFIRIGCAHYLAASGFHVGMLALFLYGLGRAVGLSKRSAAGWVVAATVFYAIMAEPRPAIFRAVVMAVAICGGLIARRRASSFNLLAASAVAFLIWRPMELFDVGFQMSYACVTGLLLLQPATRSILTRLVKGGAAWSGSQLLTEDADPSTRQRLGPRLRRMLIVSPLALFLAACLPSWPVILLSFQRFSPWAWLNTTIVYLPVALVMFVGFAILLIGAVSPWLAGLLTPVLELAASVLLWVVDLLGRMPGVAVYVSSPPPMFWIVSYYATLLAWAGVYRRALRWPVACVLTAGLAAATAVWLAPSRPTGDVVVTVLSVGRGTSSVIELPNGKAVLCDAGCSGSYDPGSAIIVPFLTHRGIGRLEAAIVSHPNLDHFGGLPTVVDRLSTGSIMVGPQFDLLSPPNKPSRRLLEELQERDLPIRTIDSNTGSFELGGARFEVLWPPPDPPFELTANESSIVLRITHQGQRILLTGDIGERAQGCLLQSGIDLTADVLLLPHHGGLHANTAPFVEAVSPNYLIQSSWRPTPDTRERLGAIVEERSLYNTADDGAIQVVLGGPRVEVTGWSRATAGSR